MERSYCIALDVHSHTTEVVAGTPRGQIRDSWSVATTIPSLSAVIETVPRPRTVVMEEGPMADWLYRHLRMVADRVIVSDPRRNHLVANDGDKDDPIDARKLLRLTQGGFIREVHHASSDEQAAFKRQVRLYHDRVRHRVSEANRITWFFRHAGIVLRSPDFSTPERAQLHLDLLPDRSCRQDAELLLMGYEAACRQVDLISMRVIRTAKSIDVIQRWQALPGIAWIRGATLYTYLDTPWRFRSKSALCRYLGIGLERSRSGIGPTRHRVPAHCNRTLKNVMLGAAQKAVSMSDGNPFAHRNKELLARGMSRSLARRTVARSMAAIMWSMWKTETAYNATWVGVPARHLTEIRRRSTIAGQSTGGAA